MTRALIAFWLFIFLGFMLLRKVWLTGYRIAPLDPRIQPARVQLLHYWKTYRKHFPRSYLTEACVACVIAALLVAILSPFFLR